jgi:hypothetical protein
VNGGNTAVAGMHGMDSPTMLTWQVPNVIAYIQNQEIHHVKKSFIEEYREFLIKFDVDYDERYIFKPID